MESPPRALITFGDSSGNPARSKKGYEDTSHHVIVTATMDMWEAQRVDAQMQPLKAKYLAGISPDRVSFHGHQLLRKLSRHGPNAKKRLRGVFDDIVDITKGMDATINVVVTDKRFPDTSHRTASTVATSWAQASTMTRSTLIATSRKTIGITMPDRYDDSTNRIVARTMARFLEPPMDLNRPDVATVISRPIFAVSESCTMAQLVDMLAYIEAKSHREDPGMSADLRSQAASCISRESHIAA